MPNTQAIGVAYSDPEFTTCYASQELGYSAAAQGTVTQATDKSTGVTLNKSAGQITLNGAALANITNVSFRGQTTGTVKADTNCKPVQNGLTNCIAIIDAANGTELHFNYSHDMSGQACLAQGDRVTITPLSDGTVKLVRG